MENLDIAHTLDRVADLLQIQGANPFRVRAYENAARTIEGYGEPLRKLVDEGRDLTELPSIGKDMAKYIEELVRTGELSMLNDLEREVPPGLIDVMRLQGVGPKRAAKLWQELDVTNLESLEAAAREGRIAALKGFGNKTEQSILDGLQSYQRAEQRHLLSEADEYVSALLEHLREAPDIDKLEVAGSWRRRKETVGDIDVLVTTKKPGPVMEHFTGWGDVQRILGAGETRASVVLRSGLQVDLRVVDPKAFGAALVYFTGSKAHNIKIRKRALDRHLHLSEYGVFRIPESKAKQKEDIKPSEGEWVAGRTEKEVYDAIDLPVIPPELREDRGEVERAEEDDLPTLLREKDLRGDLQMHTDWTDGKSSLREMVEACADRGYAYVAITDHSASRGGLDAKRARRQRKEIDKLQEQLDMRVLWGMEVDILEDGSLDTDDELLDELDYVLATVHSHFDIDASKQTERILQAVRNPAVTTLGHPTGRILGKRAPMSFDVDAVLRAARDEGVVVELDGHPHRLDLSDTLTARAKELGCKIVITSDAHSVRGLDAIRYGVQQARRAGLEKRDVLNALPPSKFTKSIGRS